MNKILKIISYIVLITFLFSQIAFADTIYFYHTDPAGTPIAMTDASGSVVWKADYKPFGEEWSITSNIENNKRFVGKEKDTETGLNYFGARYMLSSIGRFISTDPVGPVNPATGEIKQIILHDPQRLNLYSYGLNNPYKYVDDDGQETTVIITRDNFELKIYKFKYEFSYGSHASLKIDNPLGDGPVLYDPSGRAYNPKDEYGGPLRGSGDTFYGNDTADLNKYTASHEKVGSKVELYRFATTPKEEKEIADNIEKLGGGGSHGCTTHVSSALKGIGPFKKLGTYKFPGSLADKLKQIQKEQKQQSE